MNSDIKAILVEDDKEACDYFNTLLFENFPEIKIKGQSATVKDAVQKINTIKPEIIFMDIILKDGNAFEILESVTHSDFEVVFITAHNQYLEKAMEHYAFHYILKPIQLPKLQKIIKRYKAVKERMFSLTKYTMFSKFISNEFSQLMLHVNSEHIMVTLQEIIKCEADSNYTIFFLANGKKILASNTFKYYTELLSFKGFFKVHRSCLINIKHIKSIYKREAIILNTNEKIMVAQRNKSNLSKLIQLLS